MFEKESISLAAKGCFYPTSDEEKQCMAWVIECLVLPKKKHGYQQEDMEFYITKALEKKGMKKDGGD
jgi:hypothetical protein